MITVSLFEFKYSYSISNIIMLFSKFSFEFKYFTLFDKFLFTPNAFVVINKFLFEFDCLYAF